MDVADIISDIDDHGFEDTSEERKVAVLNDVYQEVCAREPWPFLEAFIRLSFNGADETATNMPADFRALLAARVEDGARVIHMRLDDFEKNFGTNTPTVGTPVVYYFLGNELHFYPIPSTSVRVRMPYIRNPDDLTASSVEADIILPREFHRSILVNGALFKLYALEDDAELAAGFQQFMEQAVTRMREMVWRKQYDSPEFVEGAGEYGDWTGVWGS